MLPQLTVRLVRHGESTWNAEGRVQGQAPGVPLTTLGVRQAEAAAELVRGCRPAAVHSSDLDRALATAAPIAAALGVPVAPEPALREQALGSLEGRLAADLAAQPAPPGVHVTSVRWGGGESMAEVHARVGTFLRRALTGPAGAERVLVTHADTIRAALAWLRGLGPEQIDWTPIPNGSVTTVVLELASDRAARRVRSVETVSPGQRAGPPFQPGMVAPGRSPQL